MANSIIETTPYSEVSISRNTSKTTTDSGGKIRIYGRVVTLSAYLKPTSAGTNMTLATIDSKYAPSMHRWLSCDFFHLGTQKYGESEAYIDSSGNIILSVPSAGANQFYKVNGIWITK